MTMGVFLFLLTILFQSASAPASDSNSTLLEDPAVFALASDRDEYPAGSHLEILRDPGGQLTLEDVRSKTFVPSNRGVPNYGYTNDTYWVRLRLRNEANRSWFLVIERPSIHYLDFYQPYSAPILTGNMRPFRTRDVMDRHFAFRLSLPVGTVQTLYLRVRSEAPMVLPISIQSEEHFFAGETRDYLWRGIFYGLLFIMAGYHILLFSFVSDKSYLYYAACLFCALLMHASNDGIAQQYLWPENPRFNWYMGTVFTVLAFVCSLKFTTTVLSTKSYVPEWDRIIRVVLFAYGLLLLSVPFSSFRLTNIAVTALAGFLAFLTPIVSFRVWRKGNVVARFYSLSWIIFFLLILLKVAAGFTLLPNNLLTESGYQVGLLCAVLLWAVTLADRIRFLQEEKSKAEAEAAESKAAGRIKDEFISMVSHEMRTPLASIRGSLGLLAGGVLGEVPERMEAPVRISLESSERLSHLLDDILDLERIQAGQIRFDMRALELPLLLQEAIRINEPIAAQKSVTLVLNQGTPPAKVVVDQNRFIQIMTNLLSNAVKFSPHGGKVLVGVIRNNGRVRVSVADEGPGVPMEFRNRIFQKFEQADASDTRQRGGAGLGLSICKGLVEKMGGTIGFESSADSGATFFFELPE